MQYKNLGKFIRFKRVSLGETLNGFAINNDIEPAILSRVENEKQDVKLGVLTKIANGFNLTVSELLAEYEQTLTIKKRS